jgi:hypothetical protein
MRPGNWRLSMRKLLLALSAFGLAFSAAIAGVGTASAAPLQILQTSSTTFGTFGDHSFCRGALSVRWQSVPKKPGVVRVTALSHGFTGDGPTWKRNPNCRVMLLSQTTSIRGLYVQKWVPASFGQRRGTTKSWEVTTGLGFANIAVMPYSANGPVAVRQGYGAGANMIVS